MKIAKKIISAIITIALVIYVAIVLIDFFQVRDSKDPKFCWESEVHKYSDGDTVEYKCLGYKVFKYNRTSISAHEFGFFIEEKGAK